MVELLFAPCATPAVLIKFVSILRVSEWFYNFPFLLYRLYPAVEDTLYYSVLPCSVKYRSINVSVAYLMAAICWSGTWALTFRSCWLSLRCLPWSLSSSLVSSHWPKVGGCNCHSLGSPEPPVSSQVLSSGIHLFNMLGYSLAFCNFFFPGKTLHTVLHYCTSITSNVHCRPQFPTLFTDVL